MSDGSGAPARAKRRRKRSGAGPAATVADVAGPASKSSRDADTHVPLAHDALAVRAWRRLINEPSLGLSAAYILVSMIGLWANFWFYRQFGLPILEYMQASDYLVAGLRDPRYALMLAASVAVAWLISWPDIYRRRHPRRVREYQRRWWGRVVFPRSDLFRWTLLRLKPETGIAIGVFMGMAATSCLYVVDKANLIRDHADGHPVVVTLAGESTPLPGSARLLGTSSAYVYLWWPEARRAEAVPIESIGRLLAPSILRKRDTAPAATPATMPVKAAAPAAAGTRTP